MADTTAPNLRRTSPSDNATSVSVTSNLTLTFNESVKAGSGFINIYKSDGTLFRSIASTDASQVTVSGRTVTINPSVNLAAGTDYYVLVGNGAIKDIAGNN
jgi:methionine-rich copper-binding protein CopC